ncbi:hypothetical protein L7F22_038536 [Adiantum nelumboides]|nr:hypothetical protein [Adiantum nelumboides]
MILGDLNARIANIQVQLVDYSIHPADKDGDLVLDAMWDRCSCDHLMNEQGSALISMMNSMQLVVMNGTKKFASSGTYTCYTSNHGRSTNDYALVSHNALDLIGHFKVGARSPNSDHTPIHVCLDLPHMPTQRIQMATSWAYRIQATKKFDYATFLDSLLSRQCMSQNISENWVTFRQAIEEAAEVTMGRSKRNHQQVKGLPHNPWFDEECKAAKRKLKCFNKSMKEWESVAKEYRMLKRKKRRIHELLKEEQEVIRFKKEPKKAWRNMKGKKEDIMGNFSMDESDVDSLSAHRRRYGKWGAESEDEGPPNSSASKTGLVKSEHKGPRRTFSSQELSQALKKMSHHVPVLGKNSEGDDTEDLVEEKTIRAVYAQMKSLHTDPPVGDVGMTDFLDAMRTEVRRAVSDIRVELEESMQKNGKLSSTTKAENRSESHGIGVIQAVADIRKEYTTKLEEVINL